MSKGDRDGRGFRHNKACPSLNCDYCVNGRAKRPHRRGQRRLAKRELHDQPTQCLGGTMSDTQYETAETSYAKDHARDALDLELERQGVPTFDPDDNPSGPDLIDLADAVVERLIKEGVTIPVSVRSLHG